MQNNSIRFLGDTLGLAPFSLRFKEAMVTLFGEEDVPRSRFGLSSLSQLYPSISPTLWRGKMYVQNKVIISNLFNHTQTPFEEGWSVKKTQIKDFRGKRLTYNSHNGTDFAIPIGTHVCTAAAGKVVAVFSQFNRGGLKIFIDHGRGLITGYAHLAKSLVQVGDLLSSGQVIAVSGYSGIDGAVSFPFGIPHVHFNVWLNGVPTDPFPFNNNISLWSTNDFPEPTKNKEVSFTPSTYNENSVFAAIASCKTKHVKDRIMLLSTIDEKAVQTIIEMNYFPTRFTQHISLYNEFYAREPRLDLPFSANDFHGVVFIDELLGERSKNN